MQVRGSIVQPVDGLYACGHHDHNGFPFYSKADGSAFLFWRPKGGKWVIGDALDDSTGVRVQAPSPDGSAGPSTANAWSAWNGNEWALESTLQVTRRPSCLAPRAAVFFGNGFSVVSTVSVVLWFNRGFCANTVVLPTQTQTLRVAPGCENLQMHHKILAMSRASANSHRRARSAEKKNEEERRRWLYKKRRWQSC